MILNKDEIKTRILEDELITDYIDLDVQLQPNGFDLTIEEIYGFYPTPENILRFEDKKIDERRTIHFGNLYNWVGLKRGVYKFKINETIKLPNDLCAITTQRSSFMRMGNMYI